MHQFLTSIAFAYTDRHILLPSILLLHLVRLSFVAEYVQKYATEEALREHEHVSSSSESSMSDFSEDEAQDMEL